jgi:hypothetical protein
MSGRYAEWILSFNLSELERPIARPIGRSGLAADDAMKRIARARHRKEFMKVTAGNSCILVSLTAGEFDFESVRGRVMSYRFQV